MVDKRTYPYLEEIAAAAELLEWRDQEGLRKALDILSRCAMGWPDKAVERATHSVPSVRFVREAVKRAGWE